MIVATTLSREASMTVKVMRVLVGDVDQFTGRLTHCDGYGLSRGSRVVTARGTGNEHDEGDHAKPNAYEYSRLEKRGDATNLLRENLVDPR